MKIIIAIDSFKGSMTSLEAGNSAACGIKRVYPDADTVVLPIADGGEGTVDALTSGLGGTKRNIVATDPLGRKISCEYGTIDKTAIIEMSAAAGITLIKESEKNPLNTTTYGVGELITDAVKIGCRNFIIGIGGSATNDCGVGMLQALGFGMLDKYGNQVDFGAKGVRDIEHITFDNVLPELKECTFNVACDVTNPLCGDNGCSKVYAPQKGADAQMIKDMDGWLSNFAQLAKTVCPSADPDASGAGTAGGMGFAFKTFLNATLKNGISVVLDEISLDKYVKDASIVVTGEGRLDSQTTMGKAPVGVAKIAKKYNKPTIAFSGSVTKDATTCNNHGIDAFFPILRTVCTLEQAMDNKTACSNMADTVEQVFRTIKLGGIS